MSVGITKAVVLARGLGTRMRKLDPGAPLSEDQARVADRGMKGMIPIGRPFLDFILSGLADAGYSEVCLVIGPEHGAVREHYKQEAVQRLEIEFAIQEAPRGTADAVAAAEAFALGQEFLVLNSDNYYPIEACRALRELGSPGTAAFSTASMIDEGGVPAQRVGSFPVIEQDGEGILTRLVPADPAGVGGYVSMNCWRFGPRIFDACRAIPPSPRGELELPDAVQFAIARLGERFKVLRFDRGVLDISSRADVAGVAERLRSVKVSL